MSNILKEVVQSEANKLNNSAFIEEQKQLGRNPYGLADLESLWNNQRFTFADILHELTDAARKRLIGRIKVILLFLVSRDSIPSDFVPLLCELLELRDGNIANEDIIELLGEAGDKRAIPSLVNVVWDDGFPGIDENYWAAKKAIQSLSEIGGVEGRTALSNAIEHNSTEIKEECRQLLRMSGDRNASRGI
ncbi:HEAT repeat domain-containing protein [Neorhodopirellula pilleata]|uniref:HEAT repeat domain-containing protein n=1 Tax=Neorhodopirellula pilleata TaxID=2714738 RepID=A0A5C6A4R6_9BACT|nr:hypothetical protein [Neorhodopirellula pilleata]TWT94952.1 hypothetical protein Pla100_35310 [Neorhodopirellula pilleata]